MTHLAPAPVPLPIRLLLGILVALHGPLIAYLANLSAGTALLLTLATSLLAVAVVRLFLRVGRGLTVLLVTSMGILGSAGMLVGWTADWGFLPVIRDGICLCGCPNSPLGRGLVSLDNWMVGGMVLASLPAGLFVHPVGFQLTRRDKLSLLWLAHAPLCFAGMILGMWLGAWAIADIPVVDPQLSFALTGTAMNAGMILGMLASCQLWRFTSHKILTTSAP